MVSLDTDRWYGRLCTTHQGKACGEHVKARQRGDRHNTDPHPGYALAQPSYGYLEAKGALAERHDDGVSPAASQALEQAARYGPFFEVRLTEPPAEAYSFDSLYAGDRLAELIDEVDGKLGGLEPRVAASTFFLGWAAKLASPALGCVQLAGMLVELDPARSYWAADGIYCTAPRGRQVGDPRSAADGLADTLIAQHVRPMIDAVTRSVRVAEALLWGNAVSALHGALRVLAYREPAPLAEAVLRAMLADGPLAGTASFDPVFRRNSCCLFYRAPGGGLCGDCPLPAPPRRD